MYGKDWTSASWGDVSWGDSCFCCQRIQVSPMSQQNWDIPPCRLEVLSPEFSLSSGSFHSFFQHSLEILFLTDHWYYGVFLPSQSPAPSSDFPMLTSILAPICQELSAYLVLLFSPLCGTIWSLVRILFFQPLCCWIKPHLGMQEKKFWDLREDLLPLWLMCKKDRAFPTLPFRAEHTERCWILLVSVHTSYPSTMKVCQSEVPICEGMGNHHQLTMHTTLRSHKL